MSAIILPVGKTQFFDDVGDPLVGGKVYTYTSVGHIPKNTYTDALAAVPHTNPIILDARGEATIYWTGSYEVVLKDSLDNTIWTVNPLQTGATNFIDAVTINDILFDGTVSIGLGTFVYDSVYAGAGFNSAAFISLKSATVNIAARNPFVAVPFDGFLRVSISQIINTLIGGAFGQFEIRVKINGSTLTPTHYCSPTVIGLPEYASMNVVYPVNAGDTIDIVGRVVGGAGALYSYTLAGVGYEMISST